MKKKSKESLNDVLVRSYHGVPVLKADEKRVFLGTFHERVIEYITEEELGNRDFSQRIKEALNNKKAKELLINSRYVSEMSKYLTIASKKGLKFKVVARKKESTDVVLVIASDKSVRK